MIKKRLALLSTIGLIGATGLSACGSSSGTAATASGTAASAGAAAQTTTGQPPTGTPPAGAPGMGTVVTGAAAKKASAAALAKYPGTAEKVMKLTDGSYVVHVISSSGEQHVAVSKAFKVTGVNQGGPQGGTPPQAPASSSATS